MGFSTRNNKVHPAAREANIAKSRELKQKRVDAYNLNPKICKQCGAPIDYEKKSLEFCSRSCAATFNNARRPPPSDAQKKKQSESMIGRKSPHSIPPQVRNPALVSNVFFRGCSVCNKPFYVRYKSNVRKTCSRDCKTHASVSIRTYQNGSRKVTYYLNSFTNETVMLESSWEVAVADELQKLGLKWIRPKPIKWIDNGGMSRLYYPDFYLPDFDVYLDPKNPYCMSRDKEKMSKISETIKLVYGSVEKIVDYINKIGQG